MTFHRQAMAAQEPYVRRTAIGTIMPEPTAQDIARAEQIVAEDFDADKTLCRVWLANHRADLLGQFSRIVMRDRLAKEYRATQARVEVEEEA